MKSTDLGDLNPAILSFAKLIISSSDTLSPSFKTTIAFTDSVSYTHLRAHET